MKALPYNAQYRHRSEVDGHTYQKCPSLSLSEKEGKDAHLILR